MSYVSAEFIKVDARKLKAAERVAHTRGFEELADLLKTTADDFFAKAAEEEDSADLLWGRSGH